MVRITVKKYCVRMVHGPESERLLESQSHIIQQISGGINFWLVSRTNWEERCLQEAFQNKTWIQHHSWWTPFFMVEPGNPWDTVLIRWQERKHAFLSPLRVPYLWHSLLIPCEVKPSVQWQASSDGAAVYHWHALPTACLITLSSQPKCISFV